VRAMSHSQQNRPSQSVPLSPMLIELQLEQIQLVRERNPQSALVLCQHILKQLEPGTPHWLHAQLTYAHILITVGQPQQALQLCQRFSATCERRGYDDRARSLYLNACGIANTYMGNFIAAQQYFQQLLEHAQHIGNLRDECRAYINLGWVYTSLEDFPTALAFFSRSLALSQQLQLDSAQAVTLENMGIIYSSLGNQELALENFRHAYQIRQQGGYTTAVAQSILNVAAVEHCKGHHRKALSMARQACKIARHCREHRLESYCLALMSRAYCELGYPRRALQTARSALRIRQDASYLPELCSSYADLGKIYLHLNSPDQACEHFERAYELATELNDPGMLATICQELYLLAKQHCAYERALHWLELCHHWNAAAIQRRKEDESSRQMMLETIAKMSRSHEDFRRQIHELEAIIEDQRREIRRLVLELAAKAPLPEPSVPATPIVATRELIQTAGNRLDNAAWFDHVLQRMDLILPGFVEALASRFPALSSMELLICALLRLQMRSKEIAELLGVTPKTVNRHREHIRAKCSIGRGVNLVTYLNSIA